MRCPSNGSVTTAFEGKLMCAISMKVIATRPKIWRLMTYPMLSLHTFSESFGRARINYHHRNRSHGCATGPRATRFLFDLMMTCVSSAQWVIFSESENGAKNNDAAVTVVFVTYESGLSFTKSRIAMPLRNRYGFDSETTGPKFILDVSY